MTLQWGRELVSVLVLLSEHGIADRDLKPENLTATDDGHDKVLDFGPAELAGAR